MSIELKPCPFCGGEAEFYRAKEAWGPVIVECTMCGCRIEGYSEYSSGGWWNDRGYTAPAGQVVAPLVPTEAMRKAARDWSVAKYGQGIGNEAAEGVWAAMVSASQGNGGGE